MTADGDRAIPAAQPQRLGSDEEQALRERGAILASIVQPVYVGTHDGVITFANPAAARVLGFDSPAELVGQNGHRLVHYKHPDGSAFPIEECPLSHSRESGEALSVEEDWWVRKDGSMVPIAYTAVPVKTSGGYGLAIAFNDTSERRAAEQATRERQVAEARAAELAASEARQRAILDAALECVISIDHRGCLTYLNAAAERTFGCRAEEVLGRQMAEVMVPPSLRDAHRRGFARHLATGEERVIGRRIELSALRADGSEFSAELAITRINLPGAPAFTGYLRDITDRQRAEEELVAARGRLRFIAEEQAALRRVATLIARQASPGQVFAAVAEEVAHVLGVRYTSVIRYDADKTATQVGVWGKEIPYPVGTSWPSDGSGVSGMVWRTNRPARADYAGVDGTIASTLLGEGLRFAVGVPITVGGILWGAMMALSADQSTLRPDIEDRLASFTELVATAIANAQARGEVRRLVDEQSALRRVATLVARNAAPGEVFDAVCEETGRLMGATNVNLAHFTPDGFNLTMAGWSFRDNHVPAGTRLPLDGEAINAIIQRTRAPARIESYDGVAGELAALLRNLGIRTEVGAPVVTGGQVWGALIAGSDQAGEFPSDSESRLASFAELIATAVSNATARAELIASGARIVTAGDAARRTLARDLHDGAQQRLVSAMIGLQRADQEFDQDRARALRLLRDALSHTRGGLQELRELAAGMHPAILTSHGLRAAADALACRCALPVAVQVPEQRYPPHVEAAAYFVIAEALTNTAKHADASSVRVDVDEHDNQLIIDVRDDGVGGAHLRGSGLLGIKDRVEALGGGIQLDSPPGRGTGLHAALPLTASY